MNETILIMPRSAQYTVYWTGSDNLTSSKIENVTTECILDRNITGIYVQPGTTHSQYLLAYTSSPSHDELTTIPVVLYIHDTDGSPAQATFIDDDLDAGELGGFVTWSPPAVPADNEVVDYYLVFLTGGEALQSPRE